MKTMLKKLIVVFMVVLLTGCSFFWTDIKIAKGITSGQIRLGMVAEDVYKATGGPGIGCVKTRQTTEAKYEMWDFATRFCGTNLMISYALVFKNNKLIEIRTVNTIRDLDW